MKKNFIVASLGLAALAFAGAAGASQLNFNGNAFHCYNAMDASYVSYFGSGVINLRDYAISVMMDVPRNTGTGQKVTIAGTNITTLSTDCTLMSYSQNGAWLGGVSVSTANATGNWVKTTAALPSAASTSTANYSIMCSLPGSGSGPVQAEITSVILNK
jgi:hypothetical protein